MKKRNILVLLLIAALFIFAACGNVEGDLQEDQPEDEITSDGDVVETPKVPVLTSFVSVDINGNAIDQTIFENYTLTMVNIWGTFCSPCIKEMPDLARINEDYAEQNVQVIGIVVDAPEGDSAMLQAALSIVEKTGANYTHLLASESLKEAKLRGVQYVPETIFVDSLGNQVGISHVGSKSYEDWSKIIDKLLTEVE